MTKTKLGGRGDWLYECDPHWILIKDMFGGLVWAFQELWSNFAYNFYSQNGKRDY